MGPESAETVGALSQFFEAALGLFGRHAATTAFLAACIESLIGLGVIFPGGTIVVLAAFAARADGGVGFLNFVAAAALGMTLGTTADYWLGRFAGRRLVPRRAPWRLACRWRHMLRRAHGFMSHWGWWAIFVSNLAGPGRSAVAVAAGASGWSFGAYLLGQSLASIAWSALYCGIGFFAAREVQQAKQLAGNIALVTVVLVAVAVLGPALLASAGRLLSRSFRLPLAQPVSVRSAPPPRRPA